MTGAKNRNRTDDLLITNQLLYQLSYLGTAVVVANPAELVKRNALGSVQPPTRLPCQLYWLGIICRSVFSASRTASKNSWKSCQSVVGTMAFFSTKRRA